LIGVGGYALYTIPVEAFPDVTDTQVTVTSTLGKRRASSTTNILDDESLKRTVDLADVEHAGNVGVV